MQNQDDNQTKHDQVVEDSFPASDPPAASGVVGPRVTHRERPPQGRVGETRPTGTATHERHATDTAYQGQHENKPGKR